MERLGLTPPSGPNILVDGSGTPVYCAPVSCDAIPVPVLVESRGMAGGVPVVALLAAAA